MTKEEIAAKREEIEETKIQIAKAEFIHNLHKLNVQFTENPHFFDQIGEHSFNDWNKATYWIVREVREAKKVAENGSEQSEKQDKLPTALQGIFGHKLTYIEDEV